MVLYCNGAQQQFGLRRHGDQRIVAAPGGGHLQAERPGIHPQRHGNRRQSQGGPRSDVGGIAGGVQAFGRGTGGGGRQNGRIFPENLRDRAAHSGDVGQRGPILALRNGQALAHQAGQTNADSVPELPVAFGVRAGALVSVDRAGRSQQAVPTRGRIHLIHRHAARAQSFGSHTKGALHGLFGRNAEARGALEGSVAASPEAARPQAQHVVGGFGAEAHRVERGGEGQRAFDGDQAVPRFEAADAAVGGRPQNRAERLRPDGKRRHPGSHGGGRTGGTSARRVAGISRIARGRGGEGGGSGGGRLCQPSGDP